MTFSDASVNYDGRKYPECAPYMGKKGQQWNTLVRDFGAAMFMKEAHDESLEDTMYGTDPGGERRLNERHPDYLDANGNLQQGNLVHANGATAVQARQHAKRAKHLFGYLYKHIADARLREMIFLQAQSDGRAAYVVLQQACSRDITDLEITQFNQDFDNSSIEADIGINVDSITLYARHLSGLNARRPEHLRKDDNAMTLRLLHAITINLSPSMQLSAIPSKRSFQHAVTGMRDFAVARCRISRVDEEWRGIFSTGQVASHVSPAASLAACALPTSRSPRTRRTTTPTTLTRARLSSLPPTSLRRARAGTAAALVMCAMSARVPPASGL